MEKKIILEINRNLELMKVKSLLNETNFTSRFAKQIYDFFTDIIQNKQRPIQLPKLNALSDNPFNIKRALFSQRIPYEDKLELISKVLFNNENFSDFVIECFQKIIDDLNAKYGEDEVHKRIMSIFEDSNSNEQKNIILVSIKRVLNREGVTMPHPQLSSLQITRNEILELLYNFLYVYYRHTRLNFGDVGDDFYVFLQKSIEDDNTLIEALGLGESGFGIGVLKAKFPDLKNIFNKNVGDKFKYNALKKFTRLNDKDITNKLNIIIGEYIHNKEFAEILKKYIASENISDLNKLVFLIRNNDALQNSLNISNTNILHALIDYIPIFYQKGNIGKYSSYKIVNSIIDTIKPFSGALKKINIAHGLILQNQKRLQKTANAEITSLFIKSFNELNDPNKKQREKQIILENYNKRLQKLYKGYFMAIDNNIYKNIVQPLNEIRQIQGLTELQNQNITEFIRGIKEDNTLDIYLKFLNESRTLPGDAPNRYIELLKAILPSPPEVVGGVKEKLINVLKTYSKVLMFGTPVNLKLLTQCIIFYKKQLKNPKGANLFRRGMYKSGVYISMFLTYIAMNVCYKIIFLALQPIVMIIATTIGVYFDAATQERIRSLFSTYKGVIPDSTQNILYYESNLGKTFGSIVAYEFKKHIIQTTINVANNQTDSFWKILGKNWGSLLIPSVLTNFENGLFFRGALNIYNYSNKKNHENFKIMCINALKDTWNAIKNVNVSEIEKEIERASEISNVKTVKLTYEVKTSPLRIYVPDFTYDYIKTIEHNGSNIKTYVRKDPTRGIIIYNFGETDANKIVITSTRNTNKYVLKK